MIKQLKNREPLTLSDEREVEDDEVERADEELDMVEYMMSTENVKG